MAGGHARRAAHAGVGTGGAVFGIAWLGLWRSRLRLAGCLHRARSGLATLVRPPDLHDLGRRTADRRAHRGTLCFCKQCRASSFIRDAWLQYWAAGRRAHAGGGGGRRRGSVPQGRVPVAAASANACCWCAARRIRRVPRVSVIVSADRPAAYVRGPGRTGRPVHRLALWRDLGLAPGPRARGRTGCGAPVPGCRRRRAARASQPSKLPVAPNDAAGRPSDGSIAAEQTDQPSCTLPGRPGRSASRAGLARLERDGIAAAAQPLQRDLRVVDQGDTIWPFSAVSLYG